MNKWRVLFMIARIVGRFLFEKKPGLHCDPDTDNGRSRTQQHFRDEANINSIIGRYNRTGILGNPATATDRKPTYGDFTEADSFLDLQNRIATINNDFSLLPADVRRKFANDPAQLIDYLADEANHDEARTLGILPKLPVVHPRGEDEPDPEPDPQVSSTPPAV